LSRKGGADSFSRYGYDANGNEVRVTDPMGRITVSVYDAANRLTETGIGTSLTDYTYDAAGEVVEVMDPDPPDAGRLTTDYAYNPMGQVIFVTDNAGRQMTYQLNNAGELVGFT